MKNTTVVAVFLALLLVLAPVAEAETIQIISYSPDAHGKSRQTKKSSHSGHLKSLEKID